MKLLRVLLLLAIPAAAGCRYDPVPAEIITSLGPEKGTPSATHRPGQPCAVCHSKYAGATPDFAVAGTIFTRDKDGNLAPAAGVNVTITDSANGLRKACTNAAGNFYVERSNWQDITFPLNAQAGNVGMTSLIGRESSCATCHALPDKTSEDPVTGAGHDSVGVILADPAAPGASCGGGS